MAKVVGISLKEFLQIVQEELEGYGLEEPQIAELTGAVRTFLEHKKVQETLRAPLVSLDATPAPENLAASWDEIHLPALPADFSWNRIANRYGRKASQLRREVPELRDILDSQNLEAIAQTLKVSSGVSPDDDLRRLQRAVSKAYGYLKLDSMDATTYDLSRIRLDRLFIAQHVREFTEFVQKAFEVPKDSRHRKRLLEKLRVQTAENLELSRFRKSYLRRSPRSVLELIQDRSSRLLVLLGDPGSGKSSLLQFVALQWAEYNAADFESLEVPLLIELREYARNRQEGLVNDFLGFLNSGAGVVCRFDQHSIAERLKNGKAALLFDGLDEVFDPEQRKEITADIARFSNDYPNSRMIVTSRIIGYKGQALRDAGFRHFMLQDLDQTQISEFLVRWHNLAYPNRPEGENKKRLLLRAIEDSKAIRELAANPLLLTMMAILNRTQDLPRDRAELYTQCSRLLLYQWKADDALRADTRFLGITIDFKDKQAMLRRVARTMQESDDGLAGNLISENSLELVLENVIAGIGINKAKLLSRAVIDHLRTRNFVLCYVGGDHYAFVHRTFLEYFCAFDFLWQFEKERSIDLAQLTNEVFLAHFSDETWHETLCLICGMLVPKLAGKVIAPLLDLSADYGKFSNILLAARCFSEIRNRGEINEIGENLRILLLAIVDMAPPAKPTPPNNADGSDETNRALEKYFQDAETRSEIIFKLRSARPKALIALLTLWQDQASLDKLTDILQSQASDAQLRDAALRLLTNHWGGHEEVFQFVFDLASSKPEVPKKQRRAKSLYRLAALSHLVRTWPDREEVISLLDTLATSKDDETLQEWAVKYIGSLLKRRPEKVEILHRVVTSDPRQAVRREVFGALDKVAQIHPHTLELAKAEAARESGGKLKRRLLKILAKAPKTDLDIPRLVITIATNPESPKTQIHAKQLLQTNWGHLQEVKDFLTSHPLPGDTSSDVIAN